MYGRNCTTRCSAQPCAAGNTGIADAFESGFWFVDQLGTLASMSHAVMCRQCFVGGNYTMVGVNDGFLPRPDYFTGLLFKRLMGDLVLTSYQNEPAAMPYIPAMRGYLHCTAPGNGTKKGSTTLAFVNTDADRSFEINLQGINTDGSKMDTTSSHNEYVLSSGGMGPPGPHQSELSSLHIKLNGKLLALTNDDELPDMTGQEVHGRNFVAPPRTYGFVVFPNANAHACVTQAASQVLVV